jgi:glycine hydroxymethyltransferase
MHNNDLEYTKNALENFTSQDPEVFGCIQRELNRQHSQIELIASENFVSTAVLSAMGSIMTNKYAEGYPGRRYYEGCHYVDEVENIAISRACKLFKCNFANVQPHSGSQANGGVFLAFLKPGDTFLGMDLAAGGHLTHGAKPTMSGKWFNPVSYGVKESDGLIDYEQVAELANIHKPKLIIAGGSSYPRAIDFKRFKEIADSCGAILMADVAHYSGLIATDEYPNPFPYADFVTTTTHKTLRGARGGMILWNNEEYTKKINSAIFPGMQGGPLMNMIAGKAVAFGEALKPEFKEYIKNVKSNAVTLAKSLENAGAQIITGGTDSHMVVVNIYDKWGVNGADASSSLDRAGITCNKNAIPFDKLSVTQASGLRFGSPAATTRGFMTHHFEKIAELIVKVVEGLSKNPSDNSLVEKEVLNEVLKMCKEV